MMTASHFPRKRFGQHFLRDPQVLNQIYQAINPQADQHLVEIGPGEGVLTELLLPQVKKLDVIEIDRDLVALLKKRYTTTQLQIHNQDILQFDLSKLCCTEHSLRIVGNLPYNISSPLLFKLFADLIYIKDMHFMLQKEVVLRMTAAQGDTHYNRLSVMTQYFCLNTLLFDIPPAAFEPPPRVNSAFVRMRPHQPSLVAQSLAHFSELVKTAFNQRRKTISNSLKSLLSAAQLVQLNIEPTLRPQQLSVTDFVKISNFLYDNNSVSNGR